jgi:cytochrome c
MRYLIILLSLLPFSNVFSQDFDVLVFYKTAGFYHQSIPAGIQMIEELGSDHSFSVEVTQDAGQFTTQNLAQYEAVVFLSTTGDVLNSSQESAFENYIHNGGGFVGIHAASDTEYDWPWYGGLVGAYFSSHPPGTANASVKVADRVHPSTEGLPFIWERTDEWYNFQENPRGQVHVLATLDEMSYSGGDMGFDHPVIWCHEYDGGRSWYTALGHTVESYSEDLFREHVWGGIQYAAGMITGDFEATVDQNFEVSIIDDNPVNALSLTVLPDLRVIYIEREGNVKLYDPGTGSISIIASLDVHNNHEDGLLGIVLDPDFATNHFIYLFYSPEGPDPVQHVSRFEFVDGVLDLSTEEILLVIPVQRNNCCHSGGDLEFDSEGNLYISTGDNTNPFESDGFSPIDERPGRSDYDAQGTSANTHDLRGKILRIKPEPGGGYSIPSGNLFSNPDDGHPEIYAMGLRNPFRIALSPENELYFGEIGPDAVNFSSARGPAGHDEFNRTSVAGNFGWPYCIADNQAYRDFNFADGTSGDFFDCQQPVNNSPNNTGSTNLPPSIPAWLYYTYSDAYSFPAMDAGTGAGRSAMAGAVYEYDENSTSEIQFPAYYDKSVFIFEWSRNWIHEIRLDDQGNLVNITPFFQSFEVNRPIDMHFGPDGAMYLIEWGIGFWGNNPDARIIKISFNKGDRTPVAVARADKLDGPIPLAVQFDGSDSYDLDNLDSLAYEWDLDGDGVVDSFEENPFFNFTEPGKYDVILKVTDNTGLFSFATLQIVAGNTRPEVSIDYPIDGGFFYWGEEIDFKVSVVDAESGSTANGAIPCESITVLPSIGHDDHSHDEIAIPNCEGSFVTNPHGNGADNVFYVLRGDYTDENTDSLLNLKGSSAVMLQPKRKEAEFYTNQNGVLTESTADPLGGGINVGWITSGDWIAFEPVSLEGITHVTFRCASAGAGGRIELRLDDPNGPLIGQRPIPVTGDWQEWDYFSLPIHEVVGTHELFLTFKNETSGSDLFNLNWMEFHGIGVASKDSFELNGLEARYFNTTDFSGPAKVVKDPMVAFDWESSSPTEGINADGFSVIWQSNLVVEQDGNYSLYAEHEGGSLSVSLNAVEVIDAPNDGSISSSFQFLEAGVLNPITVRYVHFAGDAAVKLGFAEWQTIHMTNYQLNEAVTAIEDPVISDPLAIKVYPNPFKDGLVLEVNEGMEIKSVSLYSLDGKKLQEWGTDSHMGGPLEIEIKDGISGVYILSIESKEGMYYRKVVRK